MWMYLHLKKRLQKNKGDLSHCYKLLQYPTLHVHSLGSNPRESQIVDIEWKA